MSRSILMSALFFSVLVGVLNKIGGIYFLYWGLSWFDMLMHFLGGVTLALFFIWGYYYSGFLSRNVTSDKLYFFKIICLVMLVGLGWEVFEFYFDIAHPTRGKYYEDTFLDLFFDFLGVWSVSLLIKFKEKKI
ncbi:MAG TPA: hypothetical protein PLD99_00985 [Parcubacteria group bacterium]|nr:hypothetical protein [Parcubacteria group bacterium]